MNSWMGCPLFLFFPTTMHLKVTVKPTGWSTLWSSSEVTLPTLPTTFPRFLCMNALWPDYPHLWLTYLLRFAYISSMFPLDLCEVLSLHFWVLVSDFDLLPVAGFPCLSVFWTHELLWIKGCIWIFFLVSEQWIIKATNSYLQLQKWEATW